jgi:hypothetical protein
MSRDSHKNWDSEAENCLSTECGPAEGLRAYGDGMLGDGCGNYRGPNVAVQSGHNKAMQSGHNMARTLEKDAKKIRIASDILSHSWGRMYSDAIHPRVKDAFVSTRPVSICELYVMVELSASLNNTKDKSDNE